MSASAREGESYQTPSLEDYGSLSRLTADLDVSVQLIRSVAMLAVVSAPIVPGPDPGPVPGPGPGSGPMAVPAEVPTPDGGGVLGDVGRGGTNGIDGMGPDDAQDVAGDGGSNDGKGSDDGDKSGEGSGDSGVVSAGPGGRLPFTGLFLPILAGVGMMLSLAGAWLRQRVRKRGA